MKKSIKILVADDDPEDRSMMGDTFDELGFPAVSLVDDGSNVLAFLAGSNENTVRLIVLDLNMPILNGTETLRALKSNEGYKHIPVIIFSTSINEREKQICTGLGAHSYITKPSRFSEYKDVCNMLIGMTRS